jgi:hypothetical protein
VHGLPVLHGVVPFDAPKFEYFKAVPKIQCQMCFSA